MNEDGLTLDWLFVVLVYALQVLILLSGQVREQMRRTSYERAIRAHRSW